MDPEEAATRYLAAMRARDLDALARLYSDDVEFTLPDGRALHGRAAVLAMHDHVFRAGSPVPTALNVVAGAGRVAVEIEARLADGTTRRTANFYQLDAGGHIARIGVYMQSG